MLSAKGRRTISLVAALVLALSLFAPVTITAAQDQPAPPAEPAPAPTPNRAPSYERGQPTGALRIPGPPPGVGAVVVEDGLTGPGVIPGRISCPSGKNLGEFVGEGFIIKVTGQCYGESRVASVNLPRLPDLDVPDGEMRFEAKIVSGHDRAGIYMLVRILLEPTRVYEFNVAPASGLAMLVKSEGDNPTVPLALRTDMAGKIALQDWNEYAIRMHGPDLWVIVNEQPVLSASDPAFERGGISFGVFRTGNLDDDAESAAVFRNLRVSRLAE